MRWIGPLRFVRLSALSQEPPLVPRKLMHQLRRTLAWVPRALVLRRPGGQ